MKHTKVVIIGAGAVGSTTAYALMLRNIAAEIVLVDVDKDKCKGEVFDLSDALYFSSSSNIKSSCLSDITKPDIIIIAAGIAQKPGQTRDDLFLKNKNIVTSIIEDLKPIDKNTIIIVITNPVDVMTFYVHQASGLPYSQVLGTGTVLDSLRLRGLISKKLNISEKSIEAYILGEHGESQFPVWSSASVSGVPLLDFKKISQKDLDGFAKETKQKAYEIIKCKGATFFGIAAIVSDICENIIFNQKRVMSVTRFVKECNVFLSIPSVLGCKGVEQIIMPLLNECEKKSLKGSCEKIKEMIKTV